MKPARLLVPGRLTAVLIQLAGGSFDYRWYVKLDLVGLGLIAQEIRAAVEVAVSYYKWAFVPAIKEIHKSIKSCVLKNDLIVILVMAPTLNIESAKEVASIYVESLGKVAGVE